MKYQLLNKNFYMAVMFCFIILQKQEIVFGDCPPSYCIGFNFEACYNACFDQCGFDLQCHYGCSRICGHLNADCSDEDQDGIVNICDNCPVYNPDQADANGDGIGDACQNTTTIVPTTTSSVTTSIPPTVVELSSFTATPAGSSILLKWETESEANNAGFNIHRAESENGDYIKINSELIPAKGSSTRGATYEFVDAAVQNLKTYYYQLEDIALEGTSTTHGPVHATVGSTASTTTTTAADDQCAVETIYGEHSVEVELLRDYRDTVLSRSATGRRIISQYYELSPAVVEFLRKNPAARERARRALDSMLPAIREKLVK
jgi:hypothetical protein